MAHLAILILTFTAGASCFTGLLQLALWARQPERRACLWFGLFCLVSSAAALQAADAYQAESLATVVLHLRWREWALLAGSLLFLAFLVSYTQILHKGVVGLESINQELREAKERFEKLADNIPDVFWLCSPDFNKFYYVSRAYEDVWGQSLSEIYEDADSWLKAVKPEDKQRLKDTITRAQPLTAEPIIFPEHRITLQDGTERQMATRGFPILDERGQVYRIAGISEDVTERRQAEEALRESEQMIRALVETSQDWVWAIDLTEVSTYCNPAVEDILGYGPEELIGKRATFALHPDDRAALDAQLPKWIEQKQGWNNLILRWRAKNGSWRWLESSAVPILNASSEIVGFRGIDRDVTDRIETDEKHNQMTAQLAHAGRLSILGEMVAGIAHEINQPLYSIINFSKACRNVLTRNESADPAELTEWNDEIVSAASRAKEIIKRLRGFSRSGHAHRVLARPAELIEESIDLMAFTLRQHKVQVHCEHTDCPPVQVDRVEIQQVLVNLLQNACEAMLRTEESDRRIIVRCGATEKGVTVSITDRGLGLPDDKELRIFQPFVTTKEDGLGLGLAISTTIAEGHDGRLWATSECGGGATFHLRLPRAGESLDAP